MSIVTVIILTNVCVFTLNTNFGAFILSEFVRVGVLRPSQHY